MDAQPARGIDALAILAYVLYIGVGGLLVFGFAWALRGAVETQKESICRAMHPEYRSHVHGRVTGADGKGAAGVTLAFGEAIAPIRTNDEGEFSAFIPRGAHTATLALPGKDEFQFLVATEGREAIELAITLDGSGGGEVNEISRGVWMAPDLALEDLQGNPVALSDFRGKIVVLNFWATWCEPCITEWPQVHQLAERFSGRDDVVVVALSIDQEREAIQPFLERMSLQDTPVRVLWDPTQNVQHSFGTSKIPDTYFVDPSGSVLYAYVNVRKWGSPEAYHCVDGSSR